MNNIIARKKEQNDLKRLYENGRSEFTVIYGRRRVGKTFLIRHYFQDHFAFFNTALSPYDNIEPEQLNKQQLDNFHISLVKYGSDETITPKNWLEAFNRLITLLENKPKEQRQVVFLDELPWMDIQKSGFVSAFEHFWNSWGSAQNNLLLIVCGSSTSWISEKLMNNTGGLYNRITSQIHLHPLNVAECKEYFEALNIELNLYDLFQYHMIFGGIPYYMNLIRKDLSLAANVDYLFFNKDSKLIDEFHRLMGSLFKHPENYIKAIRLLSEKKIGYTRNEIAKKAKIPMGGGLTKILKALEASDFIVKYQPIASKVSDSRYKLTDAFLLFYLHFVDGKKATGDGYWARFENTPTLSAWRGYAFENLCFTHIPQIKAALGISGVYTQVSAWFCAADTDKKGAQIDLLIDRDDRIINLCELKFSASEYSIDKTEDEKLRNRKQRFYDETKTKKAVHLTMITTYGLTSNMYSGQVQNTITMNDFLK